MCKATGQIPVSACSASFPLAVCWVDDFLGAGCFTAHISSNVSGTQFQTSLIAKEPYSTKLVPCGECKGTCTISVPWNVNNQAEFTVANPDQQALNVTLSCQTFRNTSRGVYHFACLASGSRPNLTSRTSKPH
ncbi:hypothetical protein ABBQ38_000676 [Trebouxia sp. C0009 RCD-2024]